MKEERREILPALLATAILGLGAVLGCSNEAESTVRVIDPAETGVAFTAQGPIDHAGGTVLGILRSGSSVRYLVDSAGRAVYIFTPDADSESSACTGECAEAWPPVITSGEPSAGEPAVDDDLIGTITRDDGGLQLTYDQWPLYYFSGDTDAGDTAGHGIESFQGEWYLISPEGDPIEETVATY